MNKKEQIKRHSKEKLNVYRSYLESYLSVMTHTPFDPIVIIEPFAGCGKDAEGNIGRVPAA